VRNLLRFLVAVTKSALPVAELGKAAAAPIVSIPVVVAFVSDVPKGAAVALALLFALLFVGSYRAWLVADATAKSYARDAITHQYAKRGSSGVVLILASLPMFETTKVAGKLALRWTGATSE
jgi:hypothetical protein